MGIHQKSATIDIAQVKELSKLEGDFLAKKKARDAELAKIIKGEDDRILLVHARLIMKMLYLNTLIV